MVSFDGEVKLLDFGIAKAENLVSETRAGEIKGKLGYLSPEQVTCKAVDQRSDLFSLGTVLYEWITGYKLFAGGSDVEVLRNVVEGKIYPPSYFKEDIPEPVENILMRALNRNREERYQTAWEMKFDLDQFLARHEFTPSSIHLSNFLRQIYHDELAEETRRLGGGLEHVFESGEAGTDLISAEKVKRAQTGTRSERPVVLEQAKAADALKAELLASGDGRLSVTLDIDKKEAERLKAVAERNQMTLAELIQDLLRQFTKYMD
jgi:serine/threonine-protein kinase